MDVVGLASVWPQLLDLWSHIMFSFQICTSLLRVVILIESNAFLMLDRS
jgi:hypothetical protein